MTPTAAGLIGIITLVVLLFTGIPVGFLMAIIGFFGFASVVSFDAALKLVASDIYSVFSSYSLTVVPLFVLMGQLAYHSGISTRMFDTAYKFIGWLREGSQ